MLGSPVARPGPKVGPVHVTRPGGFTMPKVAQQAERPATTPPRAQGTRDPLRIHEPANDKLAALAREINAAHEAGETTRRKSLEQPRLSWPRQNVVRSTNGGPVSLPRPGSGSRPLRGKRGCPIGGRAAPFSQGRRPGARASERSSFTAPTAPRPCASATGRPASWSGRVESVVVPL